MKTLSALLLLAAVIGTSVAVDYCDKKLCSNGNHIACRHNGKFEGTCPKDAALAKIDKKLQDLIVSGFNEKRNFIAGGGDRKHKPACRMSTMQWDPELAKLAELNVKQCNMKHEACHNTNAYPYSGQNLAWMTFYDTPDYQQLLKNSIQMWYDEVKDSNADYIKKFQRHKTGAVIGHFTAMVADRNFRIGCAASTYSVRGQKYKAFLFACNFAFTNMMTEAIYTDCAKAGKGCAAGKNPKYPNLCSTSEKYKIRYD